MKSHCSFPSWLVFILAFLLLNFSGINQLNAGVLCVSTSGDDANTGTAALPLRNIQTALNNTVAGDTIKIAAGTYNQALTTTCKVILLGGYDSTFNQGARDIFINKTILESPATNMYTDQQESTIDGFVFHGSSNVSDGAAKVFNNSVVSHNVFYGMSASFSPSIEVHGGAQVINNTVYGGSYAVEISSGTGTPVLRNNIITNASWGMVDQISSGTDRTYNCVYGNSFNYSGFNSSPGAGDISLNPKYKDSGGHDYRILYTSPCLNTGNPSDDAGAEPAGYNTIIDMGAYGGTAYSPYLPPLPAAPVLVSPDSGATNLPVNITLQWNTTSETETYSAEVADDESFSHIIIEQSGMTNTTLDVSGLSAHTTYYWRVRGANISGAGSWSLPLNFTTKEFPGLICVSTKGNDSNTGTPLQPLRNIQSALNMAVDGDTLKIAAGTYNQSLVTGCMVILLGGYDSTFTQAARNIFINKTILTSPAVIMLTDQNGSAIDGFVVQGSSNVSDAAFKVSDNSVVSHNVFYGMSASFSPSIEINGGAQVYNNTVYGGSYGIQISSGTPVVRNNIVTNASWGMVDNTSSGPDRTYNCIYGNTFNYTGFSTSPGTGDISLNPVYRNATGRDYRLLEESPCVDAGDPADSPGSEPAPYNARIDMGAYGGTIHSPYLTPVPDAPLLSLPSSNTVNAPLNITLKWNDIEEIDNFHVQVATDPGFLTGIILDNSSVSDTVAELSDLSYNQTYYWRVNASVTLGTSDWSEVWNFSTIELDQPVLYLPANGKFNPQEFTWSGIINADSYTIQISTDSVFTGIVLDSTLSNTTFIPGSLGNNLYYWRVMASNAENESPWSATGSFLINNELLFFEDFESYPTGILAEADGSPWIRYSSSREGTVIDTDVHSGEKCFQINSFTTSTEIDYVKFNLDSKPAQLNLELWYHPDGYFVYKDFAMLGLGYASSKYNMNELIALYGSVHDVWLSAEGRISDTLVFNELEYDRYNYIKVEFDFQDNEARVYVGLDSESPLRASVSFDGTIDVNTLFFAGGLNPTYIDDINVTVEGEYVLPLPQAPLLLAPANASIELVTTQTLTWQASLTAGTYHLQMDDTVDFSSPVLDLQNITATSYQLINLNYNKTYYWQVRAVNESGTSDWSETWSFTTLVTPICDRDWVGFTPPVEIHYVSGDQYNFKITLNNVGYCSEMSVEVSPVTVDDNVSISYSYPNYGSLSGSVSADGNTISGSYNIGNNDCGGSQSGTWSASRLTPITDKPTLSNPPDNAGNQFLYVTLSWDEVADVAGYSLELSEYENFATTILSDANISDNYYELSSLNRNTTYYWKIGSRNACDETIWSDTRSFTTGDYTGTDDLNMKDKVGFYPNPASNILYLEGIENEMTQVSVCTIDGKLLKQLKEKGISQIDLSDLQEGVYLLRISNPTLTYTNKIIKQ